MRKLFSITAFAFTVMAVQSASAQTAGLQNNTRGAARANVSNVQRALESRSGLLERANARARGQSQIRADVTTRNGIETRANANANARINANTTGRENSPAAGRPLLPTEAAGRLPRGLIRQRMEIEHSGEVRGRGRARAAVEAGTRTDLQVRRRRQNQEERASRRPDQTSNRRRPAALQMRAEVRNQARARADVSLAERQLMRRLAQIDKMRDTALENGNERQLKQADRLEQLARWQFENEGSARAANQTRVFTDSETMEESERTLHPFRSNRKPELGIDQSLETGIEAETAAETEVQSEFESTTTGTIDP